MITAYTQTPTEITETTLNQNPDWINVIEPEREEVDQLIEQFNVPEDFLRDPLDSEESARIEYDDETGYSLIIIDLPVVNSSNLKVLSFITQPLGIIIGNKRMFTVCDTDNEFLKNFARFDSEINLKYRSQFALNILLTIANHYNRNLRLLNKSRLRIEKRLKNNVTNKQLYNLMEVEKSLVYFLAALKGTTILLRSCSVYLPCIVTRKMKNFLKISLLRTIKPSKRQNSIRISLKVLRHLTRHYFLMK